MSQTQERIEKRRRYLKKKGAAYTELSLATLLAVPFGMIAACIFFGEICDYVGYILIGRIYLWHPFLMNTIALMLGAISWILARAAHRAHQQAKQITYAPPLDANTLPAEEVLVRGSEEPLQELRKVLLRGTDGCADTGEQGLLRAGMQAKEL